MSFCPRRQNKPHTKGWGCWAGVRHPFQQALLCLVLLEWSGLPPAPSPSPGLDTGWSALCLESQGFQVLGAECCSEFDLLILSLTTGFQSSAGNKVAQRDSGHV